MKFLLLHPGRRLNNLDQLQCFSDVWGYYLSKELARHVTLDNQIIPGKLSDLDLIDWFDKLDVRGYDAVLVLGLRYFSYVPKNIAINLRKKIYPGFVCQIYDGSRLDTDGVDITFTIKNDDINSRYQFGSDADRFIRHRAHNEYIGWAADSTLNTPRQRGNILRLLVDHTNYGENPVDRTVEIIEQIQEFYHSGIWKSKWSGVSVRRFDSGRIVNIDLNLPVTVNRYDRTGLPYRRVCREHSRAHAFFVTHPESVGLVVLETAMAGALTVAPTGFIPSDRLAAIRHINYQDKINWAAVLDNIDVEASRQMALANSWESVAKRIRDAVKIRRLIRGGAT
jgi:hypothetical protein